jgi:hypothetical protein
MTAKATKHDPRRCTTCRDYARHQKATRGPGNWTAKLGTIHLAHRISAPRFFCGRERKPGMLWALRGSLSICRACKRASRT